MRRGKQCLQAGLVVLLGAFTLSVIAAGTVEDSPRPIMHRIFEALTELLRDNLSEDDARKDPQALQREVDLLSDSTAELESHAQGQSVGFRLLSRSLADSVREFKYYYDAKHPEEARFGSLVATLGGLDASVFTGGIGENAPAIRARVCRDAAWLGLVLDEEANANSAPCISGLDSRVSGWVIPTDEELMIALHTRHVLASSGG